MDLRSYGRLTSGSRGRQRHCTQEAGTYFLYRPEGGTEVQLLSLDDAGEGLQRNQ